MARKQHRRIPPAFNLESATIPTSIQAKQAAMWAFRLVLGNVRNDLLAQNPDRFISITAPYLKWTKESFERFFFYYDGQDEERDALAKLPPQDAWEQMENETDYPVQQAFKAFRKFEPGAMKRLIYRSMKALDADLSTATDPTLANVRMLQQLLSLSDAEAVVLHLAAVANQSNAVRTLLQGTRIENAGDGVSIFSYILNTDEGALHTAFKTTAVLTLLDFLKREETAENLYELVTLKPWCHACFAENHKSIDELVRHFLEPAEPSSLRTEAFPHLAEDFKALDQYIRGAMTQHAKGVNILIYGEPGTGKTAFAKTLALMLDASLYEVANCFDNGAPIPRSERLACLKLSENFLAKRVKAMILFDEIEDVFPERFDLPRSSATRHYATTGKAWMNQTLENNTVPVIWISNKIQGMDPAYLRRFSYHLEIRTPPQSVRRQIADRYLGASGLGAAFIHQLAADARLTPAVLESTARLLQLSGDMPENQAEQLAERTIRQYFAALGEVPSLDTRTKPTDYSLDFVNIDSQHDIHQIISALRRHPNGSLCFYGLPGTGKTALASHIADALNRPLLVKRASDLLSKWLGESEKNIAAMFSEARQEQAVLLLDEADSFLRNREHAERRWEISQVNELFQQMESFDGIFICATNLFDQIDPAALRRFSFKLAFKALRPEQRERLFIQEALAGDTSRFNSDWQTRLHRLDMLAPGDFAVVKRQTNLFGELPDPSAFLAELESECQLKPGARVQTIGFIN